MKKSAAIKDLEALVFEAKKVKSTMPPHTIARPKFTDKDANGLTRCIIAYINLQPVSMAWRVNNTGIYDAKIKQHRKASTRKGIADISAIKNGQPWQIEVKHGRDKLSEDQKAFGDEVEQVGGVYCVAYSYEQFLERWNG